jgi:hypothetical protein
MLDTLSRDRAARLRRQPERTTPRAVDVTKGGHNRAAITGLGAVRLSFE